MSFIVYNQTLYKERDLDQCHETHLPSKAWIMPWRNYSIFTCILLWMFMGIYFITKIHELGCSPRVSRWIWMTYLPWTLPFFVSVLICPCKIILAFIKLGRSIWIGFSSDFILKYCERWCNSSETIVAILSYLGTCLSNLFGQLVLIVHADWRLFMETEGKKELQKQQASWKSQTSPP